MVLSRGKNDMYKMNEWINEMIQEQGVLGISIKYNHAIADPGKVENLTIEDSS